jgi:UDP-GlcNAc3NAcA epimerase
VKLITIVGARPQFVKASAVSRAIERHNRTAEDGRTLVEHILHTGQHYDDLMSGVFFRDLDIPEPFVHLGVGSGPQGWQTAQMLAGIEEVLLKERPDWVMIYGDTNSTLAGALAAVKLHIPVAHVEAGLRSFNRRMPEEHNRIVSDHLSTLLLCPTQTALENLRKEGLDGSNLPHVALVGDVMYDSVLFYIGLAGCRSKVLDTMKLRAGEYALATIHRAENTDDTTRLGGILDALARIAGEGLTVVLPLHPRTRKTLAEGDPLLRRLPGQNPHLLFAQPVSYLDMLVLERNARVILTDSGGVQKEAYWLETPCVTLRDETEWVETLNSGWNVLAGSDPDRIAKAVGSARAGEKERLYYGDGRASEKIVELLDCA